ncbi:MAG: DUF4258 domain-containing protein [Psychromonas sp.]
MMYTTHAQLRMQQRAISEVTVETLLDFGEVEFHHGCEIYSLRKALCRKLMRLKLIPKSFFEKSNGTYVVMKDDLVITAGHRRNRFKRNRK